MGHVTELLDLVNRKKKKEKKRKMVFSIEMAEMRKQKKRVCQIGRASNFEATDLVNYLSLGQVKM